MIYIPELNKEFYRSEKHYLIISYNPHEKSGYVGTFADNIAQLRRFESIRLNYLDLMTETKYLMQVTKKDYNTCLKFANFAQKIRRNYLQGELSNVITTGNLINYLKMLDQGLTEEEVIEIATNNFLVEERDKVINLWHNDKEGNVVE
jgi:hypothetical protein